MIKVEKVNKYFNIGKSNQIHVINNTSMRLPEKGIVCLLGPSGCGKTTLLNTIGGLDKVNSGKIFVDGERITRRSANKIDTIRNAKIGYIFQNFNLLDDKTVFENVAVALRMVGIKDCKIIEKRVNYCLEKVGIFQYRNKNANALSGGQRQRVAIARAIVKNPRIMIADEPTGNFDSRNTIEVMNIIKAISKERLVILVTHERQIAEFYSDYVAEMKDGKIVSAYSNDSSKYLDFQLDNKIYLKDMPVKKSFRQDDISVNVYSDEERQADIKLVVRGGNLYVDTSGKFNVVDETSNIEMIDDHYTAMDESIFTESDFEYDKHLPEDFKAKYTSIYKLSNLIMNGWKTVTEFKKLRKFMLIGFVFAAMFAFLAVSNVLGIYDVQPKDYLTTNANYLKVANPDKNEKLMEKVKKLDGVSYVLPGDTKCSVVFPMDDYFQTSYATSNLNVSIALSTVLSEDQIVYGKMPKGRKDVVIDKLIIDRFIKQKKGEMIGIVSPEQFIGRKIKVSNLHDFVIVGISYLQSPTMFVDKSQTMYILTNAREPSEESMQPVVVMGYGYMEDMDNMEDSDLVRSGKIQDRKIAKTKIKIKKGSEPKELYDVIVSNMHEYEYKIGKTIPVKMAGKNLKVVGFYTSDLANEDTMYVTAETIKRDYIKKQKNFSVYAPDVEQVRAILKDEGISSNVYAAHDKDAYIKQMGGKLRSSLIVAIIILSISLIEMFLMLRSSFLSRIKEVGTLRAIGLKKKDIYRMFAGEILVITIITAIPGIALMYYFLFNIIQITEYLAGLYMVTPIVALITFGIVLVFNMIVGLIPVFSVMRKTPASILARTDI